MEHLTTKIVYIVEPGLNVKEKEIDAEIGFDFTFLSSGNM